MAKPEKRWQLLLVADDGRIIPFRRIKGIAVTLAILMVVLGLVCAGLGWQLTAEKVRHRRTLAQLTDANRQVVHYKSEHELITAELLDKASRLKVIANMGVGYDHIDVAATRARGVVVCNVPDYGAHMIAEHAFGLMVAVARNICRGHERYRRLQRFDDTGGERGEDPRRTSQHEQAQDRGADDQSPQSDAIDVVQIEPEEQHVATEECPEQRTQRVPGVESTRHRAEVTNLAAKLVEEQREQGPRETDGHGEKREHREKSHQLVGVECRVCRAE